MKTKFTLLFIPRHTIIAQYYVLTLVSVCPSVSSSVHLSYVCPYFRFQAIIWVNVNNFSPFLVCALILWRSGLRLLMSRLPQIIQLNRDMIMADYHRISVPLITGMDFFLRYERNRVFFNEMEHFSLILQFLFCFHDLCHIWLLKQY